MKFEIIQNLEGSRDEVERIMLHPELAARLEERVELVNKIEELERVDTEKKLTRKTRYLPVPMIKKVGTKTVEPEWMEWIETLEFDKERHVGSFVNVPCRKTIADLMTNRGTIQLEASGESSTRRIIRGELNIKIFVVGKIAEKIIYQNAKSLLKSEADALNDILREGLL